LNFKIIIINPDVFTANKNAPSRKMNLFRKNAKTSGRAVKRGRLEKFGV
jgi:hypothetical protein